MLIRKLSAIAALCGICSLSSPATAEEMNVKEMLLKQQQQIEALQKKIAKQEAVHNEALTHYIKNEVDRALADHSGSLITLGSNVENLTFKGDLRLRFENTDFDNGNDRERFRQRFRLGFNWKTIDGWEIGAGLATGGSGARSTNDTVSDGAVFETGDIRLDYAYAKHKFDNGITLTAGQHKNPYINSGLLWDSDIRLVGVSVQGAYDSGIFYTFGGYQVSENGNDQSDAQMLAIQSGYKADGLTAAITYYHFNNATTDDPALVADTTGENDVHALSAFASFDGKTDDFKYSVYGEVTQNLGADDDGTAQAGTDSPDDQDFAYVLGAKISVDKFKAGYAYAHFEGDAFVGTLTDADFGSAVTNDDGSNNVEGHIFSLGYNITKNLSTSAKYILSEAIEDSGSSDDEGELLQLNFQYKF